jgi:hypothetical protein
VIQAKLRRPAPFVPQSLTDVYRRACACCVCVPIHPWMRDAGRCGRVSLAPPPAVLRLSEGALNHATQQGQEPVRFRNVVIVEGCYGPDHRGMHLLQLLGRRLLHQSVNTIPNAF